MFVVDYLVRTSVNGTNGTANFAQLVESIGSPFV